MRRLLITNVNERMTIEEALKHHWFINIKSKLKTNKLERKRKQPLPSLRTIIELREHSEIDVKTGTILLVNGERKVQ
jgi:calcium-dependent protein kinase